MPVTTRSRKAAKQITTTASSSVRTRGVDSATKHSTADKKNEVEITGQVKLLGPFDPRRQFRVNKGDPVAPSVNQQQFCLIYQITHINGQSIETDLPADATAKEKGEQEANNAFKLLQGYLPQLAIQQGDREIPITPMFSANTRFPAGLNIVVVSAYASGEKTLKEREVLASATDFKGRKNRAEQLPKAPQTFTLSFAPSNMQYTSSATDFKQDDSNFRGDDVTFVNKLTATGNNTNTRKGTQGWLQVKLPEAMQTYLNNALQTVTPGSTKAPSHLTIAVHKDLTQQLQEKRDKTSSSAQQGQNKQHSFFQPAPTTNSKKRAANSSLLHPDQRRRRQRGAKIIAHEQQADTTSAQIPSSMTP